MSQSFEKIEEQAYHAFREWPIWLVLRQIELSQHLQEAQPSAPVLPASGVQTTVESQTEEKDRPS